MDWILITLILKNNLKGGCTIHSLAFTNVGWVNQLS
jgi:hypothetical protein